MKNSERHTIKKSSSFHTKKTEPPAIWWTKLLQLANPLSELQSFWWRLKIYGKPICTLLILKILTSTRQWVWSSQVFKCNLAHLHVCFQTVHCALNIHIFDVRVSTSCFVPINMNQPSWTPLGLLPILQQCVTFSIKSRHSPLSIQSMSSHTKPSLCKD